ncbi:MAG: IPTL-CTERM sorting domain-containing protein [Burkholderiales bacterium]
MAGPVKSHRARVCMRLSIAALLAMLGAIASAAPVPFPVQTTPVKLDGVAIGQPLHPKSLNSLRFTATYVAADGRYHLWVLNGGDSQAPADMRVADITHATSTDGVNFASAGKLKPPAQWWTQIAGVGATVEPSVNYLRVDQLGGRWLLTIWSPNETGTGLYNYNANVWEIGSAIDNLDIVQHGPLPTLSEAPPGPGGNFVGSFGMAAGQIYLRQDTNYAPGPPANGGGIGRYAYTDGTRPALSPIFGTSEAGMFGGTPYCWPLGNPDPCASPQASYVHNSGRVVTQQARLGAYYAFRDIATGARQDKQVWYVESADDGLTWSAPVGVFANGGAVTVDGQPATANFSSPEVAAVRNGYRAWFSTAGGDGKLVVVTGLPDPPAIVPPVPALSAWMLAVLATALALAGVSARRRAG